MDFLCYYFVSGKTSGVINSWNEPDHGIDGQAHLYLHYLIWEEKFTYTVLFCGYCEITNQALALRNLSMNWASFSAPSYGMAL